MSFDLYFAGSGNKPAEEYLMSTGGNRLLSYWNDKNVTVVDAMRSPLTYRSEHNLLNFIKNIF